MVKAYCVVCGSWENVHPDGKCHIHHYKLDREGYAFPVAATPEAVAREVSPDLVAVEFPAQTGDYFNARRREADEALAVAKAEPILGRLTKPEEQAENPYNRVSPAGADADEKRREPGRALPAEVKAAIANVEGRQRDVAEVADPPQVAKIDPKEAGDADKKPAVAAAVKK